jgi:hypothetical protein
MQQLHINAAHRQLQSFIFSSSSTKQQGAQLHEKAEQATHDGLESAGGAMIHIFRSLWQGSCASLQPKTVSKLKFFCDALHAHQHVSNH